jgi:hypothetical protein
MNFTNSATSSGSVSYRIVWRGQRLPVLEVQQENLAVLKQQLIAAVCAGQVSPKEAQRLFWDYELKNL